MNPINLDILLIEDNLNDSNLISELLDNFNTINFNIKHYTRLRDGLSTIKMQKFDAILLDISLPDSHGIETISQVLNMTQNIPIIVLTGEDDDILAVKSVKKGAQDYLVKGQFDKISLIRSIKYGIERKRLELSLKESKEKLIESEANLRFLNEELEKKVQERTYVLNERVKELSCLYDISKILEEPKITIKNAFQKVVDRIPASMQYPEIACSRIVFDDHEFKTKNFEETQWKLSTEIRIDSKAAGIIEIIYTLEKPEYYEGPFLKEEMYLINTVAEILRRFIERRQVEDAIRLTHTEFATIFNTAGGGMRVVGMDYNVLRFNSPFAKLVGASEAELADKKCYEQFPGLHCETPLCTMNQILAGEERVDVEVVKKRKDGRKIPCMLVATPLRSTDGKLIGMVEDFRDITDSKKAEAAAKQAHAEITTIFNAAGDGMRVINTDYIVLRANQTFVDLVGVNEAEIVNKNCYEHFPHPNCHTQQCTLKRILAGEDRVETEVVKERSDGSKVPCILVATPFLSTDGEFLGIVEVFKDITERKQSEEILRESEEKFRALVKTSPYSIALLNTKGNILDCNQITEKYLSLPRNEIINTNVMNLDFISENDKYLITNVVQELMESRITEPREFEFMNKKGEKVWLENIISYVKIGGKDYIQIISVDITERKTMEIIREKEVEKLKELDTLKDYFVLRLSHELKTPLNSIYSASTILLNYYHQSFDERVKKLVKIINAGGERLNNLIKDLLDVSRIESNIFELNTQKVNIVGIIKNVVNDLYSLIIKRELSLKVSLEEDYYLEVDKIRFDQVIMNLVSNAIKNTPRRGIISVSLQKCDDYIDIKVKDTGVGFTEEEKKRVFKKFGKIERYGKGMDIISEGSGLGLYISKKIVELHGGKILLESEGRDRGATLIVRLPKN